MLISDGSNKCVTLTDLDKYRVVDINIVNVIESINDVNDRVLDVSVLVKVVRQDDEDDCRVVEFLVEDTIVTTVDEE